MLLLGGPVFMDDSQGKGASQSHGATHEDVFAIARKHKEKGYAAAYVPQVRLDQTDRLRDIRNAFAKEGVMLAEVQSWDNLLHPDPSYASRVRDEIKEALAVAEEVGARCAITTVGSFRPESLNHHSPRNFTQEAFDAAVEIARDIIDSVKPRQAFFTFEILSSHIVDSPDNVAAIAKAVDRPQFGVHIDLVNFIASARDYWNGGANLIREVMRLCGDRVIGAHVKDIELEDASDTVRLSETRPGLGRVDYVTYLTELAKAPRDLSLLMEHLPTEAEYDQASEYIHSKAAEAGVELQ